MRKQIITLALASLLSASTHAMGIKPLSLGLGALASVAALAYAYTKQSKPQPSVKMHSSHTPGIEGVLNPFLRFTLYKADLADDTIIGSICTNYCPATHSASIETIKVSAEYQKHGYGKQLWDRTIAELKKHDIHEVTWKAVPIDLPPSSVGTDEYQQKLDVLVAWYTKRGGSVTEKNSTEARMKLLI